MGENSGTDLSVNALDSLLTTVLPSYPTLGLKHCDELVGPSLHL